MATRATKKCANMMMRTKKKKPLRNLPRHSPHFSSRAQFNQAGHFPTGQTPTDRISTARVLTVQIPTVRTSTDRISTGRHLTGRKLSIPSEKIWPAPSAD